MKRDDDVATDQKGSDMATDQTTTPRPLRRHRPLTLVAVGLVFAVVVAACGGDDDESVEDDPVATDETDEIVDSETNPGGDQPDDDLEPAAENGSDDGDADAESPEADAEPEPETDEPAVPDTAVPVEPGASPCADDVPADARAVTFQAMGGLCAQVPADVLSFPEGDFIGFTTDDLSSRAVVARVSVSGANIRIEEIDDLVTEIEDELGAEVAETDETLVALGREFTKYEVRGGGAPPEESVVVAIRGLFSTNAVGFVSNQPWTPGPEADLFLASTGESVIVLGAISETVDGIASARDVLDRVVPALRSTTEDGRIAELPDDFTRIEFRGEAPSIEPDERPDGPPALLDPFMPVEPGTYQLPPLGMGVDITIGDDWDIAPNFPGFVVFTHGEFVLPAFRDVVLQREVNAIHGIDYEAPNGPRFDLDDVETLLTAPPDGLVVSNIDREATLGGVPAVRFDVTVDPTATCQDGDPCTFLMTSPQPMGQVKQLRPGSITRIWLLDDPERGRSCLTWLIGWGFVIRNVHGSPS